jgi:glucose/arabinose dehydrogenase
VHLRTLLSGLLAVATLSGVSLAVGLNTAGQEKPKRTLLRPEDLPKPYATPSASNAGKIVPRPEGAELKMPPGFKAEVFAEGFEQPRWLSVSPNGDVFVAEARAGRITVLRPGSDGKPTQRGVFAEEVPRPFGIVFHKEWMYVAVPDGVVRFAYKPGQLRAEGEPEKIVSGLPTEGHWTRSLAYSPKNNKMYVSIGSSKDWGEETEPRRATVCEFNPDGSGFRIFATGLRNVIGIACHPQTGVLWTTVQERDALGDDLVPDYVTSVKEGGFYGWPYYYIGKNHDPRLPEKPELAAKSLVPEVLLTSHTAAMCMLFYTGHQFPKEYQGDALVALHGSGNRTKRVGYSLIRVPFKNGKPVGGYEDFVTGWMLGEDDPRVWGRPVGLAQGKDGSLFMVDDGHNTVWRISYQK